MSEGYQLIVLCVYLFNKVIQEEGVKVLSYDALFGLCRKKHSGKSLRPPLFGSIFFENQEEVDTFVQEYDSSIAFTSKVYIKCSFVCIQLFYLHRAVISSLLEIPCDPKVAMLPWMRPQFLAVFADMNVHRDLLISSMVKGIQNLCVFIIVWALCRLSYGVFMLEKLKSGSGNLQHIVLYDIACTLQQHLSV